MDTFIVKIDLTIPEVNATLAALGELPFKLSSELIKKIKDQAQQQVNIYQTTLKNETENPAV